MPWAKSPARPSPPTCWIVSLANSVSASSTRRSASPDNRKRNSSGQSHVENPRTNCRLPRHECPHTRFLVSDALPTELSNLDAQHLRGAVEGGRTSARSPSLVVVWSSQASRRSWPTRVGCVDSTALVRHDRAELCYPEPFADTERTGSRLNHHGHDAPIRIDFERQHRHHDIPVLLRLGNRNDLYYLTELWL